MKMGYQDMCECLCLCVYTHVCTRLPLVNNTRRKNDLKEERSAAS